ncbi:maturation protein, partial [ssRNA phage Gephyllon.3_15]
ARGPPNAVRLIRLVTDDDDPNTPHGGRLYVTRTRTMPVPDYRNQVQNGRYTKREVSGFARPALPLPVTDIQSAKMSSYVPSSPTGRKYTTDESHPRWRSRDKPSASDGDYGGSFDSYSQSVTVSDGSCKLAEGILVKDASDVWHQNTYFGPWLAVNPAAVKPFGFAVSTTSQLNALGTTAIARCKPTNSTANVSVMLGELWFDGLPKLFGMAQAESRTLAAKASSEYLNTEFGWKPLVSDIQSVAYAVANWHRILSEYERLAGRPVRRRYVFPVERTTTYQDLGPDPGFYPNPFVWNDVSLYNSSRPFARLSKQTVHTKETWFSGAFTYHAQPIALYKQSEMMNAVSAAQHLLGLELTPETVWNLAPWSWAIDWFSNAGDVISNLSDAATDGLVMKYGYIMEKITHEETYTLVGPSPLRFASGVSAGTVTLRYESKRRLPATPFGFGLSWNSFSPRQLAITAALGITRLFR